MNSTPATGCLRSLVLALAAGSSAVSWAQAIEVSTQAFGSSPALPFAPAAQAVPAPAAMPPSFVLRKDEAIHEALQSWAKLSGWELIWYPGVSWKTLRGADLSKQAEVTAAVAEVIDILRDEGKPVRLRISDGNKVMEVLSNEVRND